MLDGLPSSSEKPLPLGMGYVTEDQMSNPVGLIFHNNWEYFSPLLYSHYGADVLPRFKLQRYFVQYRKKHPTKNNDGHLYDCCHMMRGFIQTLDEDIHERISSLSEESISRIKSTHLYSNAFCGGCYLINVSEDKFGIVDGDGRFNFVNNNVLNDLIDDSDY